LINSEVDSDEEYERTQEEKRRQGARRHWAIVRRHVNQRIKRRKESNTALQAWDILRHQVRAKTHAETVRRELYIKYGAIKPSEVQTDIEPVKKPCLSPNAHDLIQKFHSFDIKRL